MAKHTGSAVTVVEAVAAVKSALSGSEVTNAAPVKLSSMNRVMFEMPRVVEAAVESAHRALTALKDSATVYGKQVQDMRAGTVESLCKMLDDIRDCLTARKAGAKEVKNASIDAVLLKSGVKEPRPGRNKDTGKLVIGSKSGASRYIAVAVFQTPALWPDKKLAALKRISAEGFQYTLDGPRFKTPYEALAAGVPFSTVHDVTARTIASYNGQGKAAPTKFERTSKAVISMSLAERKAMIATLTATIPAEVPTTPATTETPAIQG